MTGPAPTPSPDSGPRTEFTLNAPAFENPHGRFGSFGGVFTPSILTILGVVMYLRFGWVVGNAGLLGALVVVLLSHLITTATGLGIAILSIVPYNYFNSRVEKAVLNIEKYATSLEIVFEKLDANREGHRS